MQAGPRPRLVANPAVWGRQTESLGILLGMLPDPFHKPRVSACHP
jgi:hypothetical protein